MVLATGSPCVTDERAGLESNPVIMEEVDDVIYDLLRYVRDWGGLGILGDDGSITWMSPV